MSLTFFTYDERPELRELKRPLLDVWPRFMLEDEVSHRCWSLPYERFGSFQHFLVDLERDALVAEVNSVPVELDPDALPARGWDEVLDRGTTGEGIPTVVSALQVLVSSAWQGRGLVFPETGDYVVPGALELVHVDRETDRGTYVEPNVWMRHRL